MDVEASNIPLPTDSTDGPRALRTMAWTSEGESSHRSTSASVERAYRTRPNSSNVSGSARKLKSGSKREGGVPVPQDKGIRVIANEQIIPPPLPLASTAPVIDWVKVGRNGKPLGVNKQRVHVERMAPSTPASRSSAPGSSFRTGARKAGKKLIKPAVVTITSKTDGATYAEILAKAKQRVSLKGMGIENTRIRRAINGAIIIEVPGPQGRQQAGLLAANLSVALGEEARVSNPVESGELRIRGIDPFSTVDELLDALETLGGCSRSVFKTSPISRMRDGMRVAWVSCPLEIAIRIAEQGPINLGWTRVRVELMRKRPVQCFRCWRFGHVRSSCDSQIERTGLCFRCGCAGHSAAICSDTPRCLVCLESGKDSTHRIGTPRCLSNQGFPVGVQPIGPRRQGGVASG